MDIKTPYFAIRMTMTARSDQFASRVSGIERNQVHLIPVISIKACSSIRIHSYLQEDVAHLTRDSLKAGIISFYLYNSSCM